MMIYARTVEETPHAYRRSGPKVDPATGLYVMTDRTAIEETIVYTAATPAGLARIEGNNRILFRVGDVPTKWRRVSWLAYLDGRHLRDPRTNVSRTLAGAKALVASAVDAHDAHRRGTA